MNPKASEFGLEAHPKLTSLCLVDAPEKKMHQQNFLRSMHE